MLIELDGRMYSSNIRSVKKAMPPLKFRRMGRRRRSTARFTKHRGERAWPPAAKSHSQHLFKLFPARQQIFLKLSQQEQHNMPRRIPMWAHFQLVGIPYSGNLKYLRYRLCHNDFLFETQIQYLRQKREENRECGHREAKLYGCVIGRNRDMCRHLETNAGVPVIV